MGYDGWFFYVYQGVIFGMEGVLIWWGCYMDMLGGWWICWMGYDDILGYGDYFIQLIVYYLMQDFVEQFVVCGFESVWIGVEMENYYYFVKVYDVLVSVLLNVCFVDVIVVVNWQWLVKLSEEIGFICKVVWIFEKVV